MRESDLRYVLAALLLLPIAAHADDRIDLAYEAAMDASARCERAWTNRGRETALREIAMNGETIALRLDPMRTGFDRHAGQLAAVTAALERCSAALR